MVKEDLGSATALLGELGRFLIFCGSLFSSLEMRGLGKVIHSSSKIYHHLFCTRHVLGAGGGGRGQG